MTDLDSMDLFTETPATPTGAGPRRHRHVWEVVRIEPITSPVFGTIANEFVEACHFCGKPKDEARSRRGRSARRLGGDQERRIERVYGPRKVGEYGDPVDHLGRDFKWQSKATRRLPPLWLAAIDAPTWVEAIPQSWFAALRHMADIGGARLPLLVRPYVSNGVRTRDWIVAWAWDWYRLHGPEDAPLTGFVVMAGAAFLDIHGRDEP